MVTESVEQRDKTAREVQEVLSSNPDKSLYASDVVERLINQGFSESDLLSTVWRLIDEHMITMDNFMRLSLTLNERRR
jgi:hypothetical protein